MCLLTFFRGPLFLKHCAGSFPDASKTIISMLSGSMLSNEDELQTSDYKKSVSEISAIMGV